MNSPEAFPHQMVSFQTLYMYKLENDSRWVHYSFHYSPATMQRYEDSVCCFFVFLSLFSVGRACGLSYGRMSNRSGIPTVYPSLCHCDHTDHNGWCTECIGSSTHWIQRVHTSKASQWYRFRIQLQFIVHVCGCSFMLHRVTSHFAMAVS